jgi:hypothetical protein
MMRVTAGGKNVAKKGQGPEIGSDASFTAKSVYFSEALREEWGDTNTSC